ncbi:MAG: NAD(P)/FAD-dependent oxidoreductase [Betaproteobacteria bacterium]
MKVEYDAIIVGGGPSGATAAVLLTQAGWSVAIVEKTPFPRRKVCGEFISETTWPLLRELGVAEALQAIAGPIVRRVGVFAGSTVITSPLQRTTARADDGGRAVGREYLDTLLLQRAAAAGAEVLQPWTLSGFGSSGDQYACRINEKGSGQIRELRSRLIIGAHGSWETGVLPTQVPRQRTQAGDLFGFKAHFRDCALANDLMPLLAFPGGYGGMVHTDHGRVSLSCCIRRDTLERCRKRWPHLKAGAAVLAHIEASCRGVAEALAPATLDGTWLSAGPLRTGIRSFGHEGIFAVGNAAAEAHPIVAEGISMAIQSAHLLCAQFVERRVRHPAPALLETIHAAYEAAWRRNFFRRLQVASMFAHLFMRPLGARVAAITLRCAPKLLTYGANWSGKIQPLRRVHTPRLAGGLGP